MNKKGIMKKTIIIYEIVGFVFIIFYLWAEEIFDLPHNLLGAEATPINWVEATMETVIFLIFGALIVFMTRKFLNHIRYLEGFLPVCSFCKKIRVGSEWISIENYITEHSEAEFSHGLCPECIKKHYSGFLQHKEILK
jgi:hypothetical protein